MAVEGCQLNIFVLQQNIKNIESDVELERAAKFFDLFMLGPDGVVQQAKRRRKRTVTVGKNSSVTMS